MLTQKIGAKSVDKPGPSRYRRVAQKPPGRCTMRNPVAWLVGLVLTLALALPLGAQQAPPYETKKVADGWYVFRHMGHQAMFVVSSDGVVATYPISPVAAKIYLEEIRKITPAPVRYVVYSHHHLDHIAGGAPFKEAGAVFVAHRRGKDTLQRPENPAGIVPPLLLDDRPRFTRGGDPPPPSLLRPHPTDRAPLRPLAQGKNPLP